MEILKRLKERAPNLLNKSYRLNGKPFNPDTRLSPPAGQHSWVHYGVMIPDLPNPHHIFNVLSIVGTPGATAFDNDFAVTTSPKDTAYLLSHTAAMVPGQFRSYSIEGECEFATDGSLLRFGNDLTIEGRYPHWTVYRQTDDTCIRLTIEASDCVSRFAHIPGLYEHWSLLCRYSGQIVQHDRKAEVAGLCTFEYASGVGRHTLPASAPFADWKLPLNYFTYQIINLNESTQLLLVAVLGPKDFPIQQAVYLRSLNDHGEVFTRNVAFTVTAFQDKPAITPDGFSMKLPRTFSWYAEDDQGEKLLALECTVAGRFEYGLGAGYASWYRFTGECRGKPVSGQGYLEFIDRRP